MKRQGPIWLGLTERAVSLRLYPNIVDIRAMVARSAYAQLGYSCRTLQTRQRTAITLLGVGTSGR